MAGASPAMTTESVARPVHVDHMTASRGSAGAAQAEQAPDATLVVTRLRRRLRNGTRGVARDDRLLEALNALGERADVVATLQIVGIDGRAQRDDVAAGAGDGGIEMIHR